MNIRFHSALASVALAIAAGPALATPTPSGGTLTESNAALSFSGGPLATSPTATANNKCANNVTSDVYALLVSLPSDFTARRPNDSILIKLNDVPTADMVLSLLDKDGNNLLNSDSNSVGVGEQIQFSPKDGDTPYKVAVCVFAGSVPPNGYSVDISISSTPTPPAPPPPLVGGPRLVTMQAPLGMGDSAGEPSIGYDLKTKRGMYIAGLETLKVTPAEYSGVMDAASQPLPKSCPVTWDDVSFPTTDTTSLDPILFTNQSLGANQPGRTFASQLTGANSAFAFTDDDGANWTPGQIGTPNGGVDHQTVGAGPYPAPSATFAGAPPGNPGYAVYYCSQTVADAFCARSDTGGQSFNPGVPLGKSTALGCATADLQALHGHARIAPDGAVAIPFRSCGGQQGFMLSTDAGATWTSHKIAGSTSGATDPQLAWSKPDSQGKSHGYFCYVDGDGKPKVSVTTDRGSHFSTPYNLGAQVGVQNAVFAQGIAGDSDRAACAFIGSTTAGNHGADDFTGVWFGFVAYTFDGGASWHTLNVTPDDPVQGQKGICTDGTTCGTNRNLLDFNEITLDEKGRVWFGYADGCISTACITSGGAQPDYSAKATIARQIGGRGLYAAFDSEISTIPQEPCLSGDRGNAKASLSWVTPDSGGQTITGYKIWRSTSVNGTYVLLATLGLKNVYDDLTADASVPTYYYKVQAIYAGGDGLYSNLLNLSITVPESSCELPGITVAQEGTPAACTGTGGGCTTQTDLQNVHIAELLSQPDKFEVTVKVASLSPQPAPGTYWYVLTQKKTGPSSYENLYLAMDTSQGAPRYTYGTYTVGTLTTFTEQGTIDASSSWDTDGNIRLVAARTLFGSYQVGDSLSSVEVRTRSGDSSLPSRDVIGPGSYTIRGTDICMTDTAPIAILDVDVLTGLAPLDVTLTGSGTDADAGDTISTYSLDFGDNSTPVAQNNGNFGTHQYAAPGNYPARLFVVDSHGTRSSNTAEKVISVYGHPVANAGADFSVSEGQVAMLDGSKSDNANGGPLTYTWTQTAGPAVSLVNGNTATPTFGTPGECSDNTLTFHLDVSADGGTAGDDVSVDVTNVNAPPVANAGPDASVRRGGTAQLDGRGSTHDGCLSMTYLWTQTGGPLVTLSDASSPTPTFAVPDVSTDTVLGFRLTVTDSTGKSSVDDVVVTIDSHIAPFIGNDRVGGLPALTLLLLGAAGVLRRVRRLRPEA